MSGIQQIGLSVMASINYEGCIYTKSALTLAQLSFRIPMRTGEKKKNRIAIGDLRRITFSEPRVGIDEFR